MNSDRTIAGAGLVGSVATLVLDHVNAALATATGICALIVVLPRAIRTARNTDWKRLILGRR